MREAAAFFHPLRAPVIAPVPSRFYFSAPMNEAISPPFERAGPARPASPVVLSVPHAGRDYTPELLAAARVPRASLELLEDRLVDRLVWRAVDAGATAFIARAPRAAIDLNRDEREVDPGLISPPLPSTRIIPSARARGGIGLIPSRLVGVGALWRGQMSQAELARRIETIHRPYHAALAAALAAARARFGVALLLDCHSMPPRAATGDGPPPQVVLGDRHHTSAGAGLMQTAIATSEGLGYRTACNAPYSGGHVVGLHGRPEHGVHALQIEIDRALYLDSALRAPGPGFGAACRLIETLAAALAAHLLAPPAALAAE
jgi:N-formylglutamate amidohydrolase